MERSTFADVLYKALLDSGFKYHGKLTISDEDFNSYKDLSPKQMAVIYAEKNNLEEKNKVLRILQEIHAGNVKNKYTYSLYKILKERNLNKDAYQFVFHFCIPSLIQVKGKSKAYTIKWIPEQSPLFSDAEAVFLIYQQISNYKLSLQQEKFIEKHVNLNWEELFNLYKQTFTVDSHEINQIKFGINRYRSQYKHKLYLRQYAKTKTKTYSTELKRVAPAKNRSVEELTPIPMPETEHSKSPDLPDNPPGILFLLKKRMKLYSEIIKNQKAHIKHLEKYIARLEKTN